MAARERQKVQYGDLREYLELLQKAGLLKRITAPVDLKFEIGAICARALERKGPGLLFENITGYEGKPLVSNIIYSVEQLAVAFNTVADIDEIYAIIVEGHRNRLSSITLETGPCKETVRYGGDIDLYEIPTPWWHELDGGQYIGTSSGIVTRDPDTGILNMGTYRCMIVDPKTLTSSGQIYGHIKKYEVKGLPTPVAVVMGMDPLLTLASGSPVPPDAHGRMEYEAAGAWRGSPTELVKCETSDLLVPAHAEVIIEGEVLPGTRMPEGPHGEAGGFYGQRLDAYPIQVKCITHRRNPIAYGIICLLDEDYPRWLFRSGAFEARIKKESGLRSIRSAYFPELGGRNWGGVIIAADIKDPAEAGKIIAEAWKIVPDRWVIVVDDDCDIRNWNDVMWRVVTNVRHGRDLYPGKAVRNGEKTGPVRGGRNPMADIDNDIPDPTGIDATFRFKFDNLPPVNKVGKELMAKVAARWKELGLP
ncbi:MAG: UbiD family decarboxylase [Desulfobacterales bacterium]|nr:UbiD family decarboxylase [Desulfobacterales bacterium]